MDLEVRAFEYGNKIMILMVHVGNCVNIFAADFKTGKMFPVKRCQITGVLNDQSFDEICEKLYKNTPQIDRVAASAERAFEKDTANAGNVMDNSGAVEMDSLTDMVFEMYHIYKGESREEALLETLTSEALDSAYPSVVEAVDTAVYNDIRSRNFPIVHTENIINDQCERLSAICKHRKLDQNCVNDVKLDHLISCMTNTDLHVGSGDKEALNDILDALQMFRGKRISWSEFQKKLIAIANTSEALSNGAAELFNKNKYLF